MLEIEELFSALKDPNHKERERAEQRLVYLEQVGQLPIDALEAWAKDYAGDKLVLKYLVEAFIRNQSDRAKAYLKTLYTEENDLLLLLQMIESFSLLGISSFESTLLAKLQPKKNLVRALFSKKPAKNEASESFFSEEELMEELLVPTLQALEHHLSPFNAEKVGKYLNHKDPIVRYSALKTLSTSGIAVPESALADLAKDENQWTRDAVQVLKERQAAAKSLHNNRKN